MVTSNKESIFIYLYKFPLYFSHVQEWIVLQLKSYNSIRAIYTPIYIYDKLYT